MTRSLIASSLSVHEGSVDRVVAGTAALFNVNTTTLNLGGAATTVSIGALTGTTTVRNALTASGGVFSMNNATSNIFDFGAFGAAAPTFATRSAGTKLVLWNSLGASSVDYAIGIEGNTQWSSVPTTGGQFKWYAGTTNIATLSGGGALRVGGTTNGAQVSYSLSGVTSGGTPYVGTMWMMDTSWIRFDKGIWAAGNTIGTDGDLSIGYGGHTDATWRVRFNYNTLVSQSFYAGSVQGAGLIHSTLETTATGTSAPWTSMGIRAQSQNGGSSTNSAGFVAWVPGIAPQMRVYQASGEVWNFLNNPNTGFIPLWASAFTVQSTLRSKKDITTITDEEILTRLAETPRVVRYRYKVGPQTLVPDERFADVDARWQASGRAPLTPQPHHLASQEHDCVAMNCAGDANNPCPITVNSEPDVGVIAEEWDEVWPEVVWVDSDGEVGGVDYARIAPLAMRAAAILMGRVEELTARVAALETPES